MYVFYETNWFLRKSLSNFPPKERTKETAHSAKYLLCKHESLAPMYDRKRQVWWHMPVILARVRQR